MIARRFLLEDREKTCNGGQKGNPFHQRCGQDHVAANFTRCFRLAGNGFNGSLTDLTDTDTGTDSGKTCADRTIAWLYHI
jgi:hypothetical protein